MHLGGDKAPKSKLKGERIPVLTASDRLEPNDALKGVGFSIPAAQPQADWPQAGGDPAHDIENVVAAPQMKELWRRDIGKPSGVSGHITASPILADGKLFVMDAGAVVTALDPATGRELWKSSFQPRRGPDMEEFGGGLAYADGALFVSSGYRFVAAMNPQDGTVKWRRDIEVPVHGAPTVAGGKLFVVDVEDELLTFATADGAPGWTFQGLDEPARMLAASSPAVNGDSVVSGFASGELVALSTANGSTLWQTVLSLTSRNNALSEIRDIPGRPLIYRGDAIAGGHAGVLAAVDLAQGQARWSLPITTSTTPWPAGRRDLRHDPGGPARLHQPRGRAGVLDPRPQRRGGSQAPRHLDGRGHGLGPADHRVGPGGDEGARPADRQDPQHHQPAREARRLPHARARRRPSVRDDPTPPS